MAHHRCKARTLAEPSILLGQPPRVEPAGPTVRASPDIAVTGHRLSDATVKSKRWLDELGVYTERLPEYGHHKGSTGSGIAEDIGAPTHFVTRSFGPSRPHD